MSGRLTVLTPSMVNELWRALWLQDNVREGRLFLSQSVFFGEEEQFGYFEDNSDRPFWGVYYTNNYVIVLCAGLNTANQGVWLHYSWSQRSEMELNAGMSGLAMLWARHIYERAFRPRNWQGRQVILVGHSGGGPTMEALGFRLWAQKGDGPFAIITGGAPRTGLAQFASLWPRVIRYRIMIPYDPVCYLPPHEHESPASWLAEIGLRNIDRLAHTIGYPNTPAPGADPPIWNEIIHSPGGLMVYEDGSSITTADPLVPPAALNQIVNWLIASDSRHSKSVYAVHINAWARRWELSQGGMNPDPENVHQGSGEWGVAQGPPAPGPELVVPLYIVNQDLVATLRLLEEPVVAAQNPLAIVSQPKAGGGKTYGVYLTGKLIAEYGSRGRANTCARFLAKWLSRLPVAEKVDRDNLVMAITTYLDYASVGNGISRQLVAVV